MCMHVKLQQLNSVDIREDCSVTQNQRERDERERECREQRGNKTMKQQQNWRVDISQLKTIGAIA